MSPNKMENYQGSVSEVKYHEIGKEFYHRTHFRSNDFIAPKCD